MPARKRGYDEMEPPAPAEAHPLIKKLRNNWMFANLMQYIYIFGDAVKIDRDFDIEDLEAECLRSDGSPKLAEIGLCLLKNVSSHRGLTPENFDEYTRRQYQSKKPTRNPLGDDENPVNFQDLDITQKIKVLVDLSQWTLINANSIKEKMELSEKDQASDWRIEPCGWDRDEKTYFLLDDNRLYRRTDPPIEIPKSSKPIAKSTGGRPRGRAHVKPKHKPPPTRGTRASKRLKITHDDDSQQEEEEGEEEDTTMADEQDLSTAADADNPENEQSLPNEDDSLGGMIWECVAVTLDEYNDFLFTIQKSKDPNEKTLYKFITTSVMPIIEAAEEKRRQKALRRLREVEALQKLATAKRSSRIADKRQNEIVEAETRAIEEKRRQDLREAQAMLLREQQMEQDRESRRLTREQRIKERELRRVLEEEALNNLTAAEAQSEQSEGEGRKSRRRLKVEIEKKRRAVEELQQEEEWVFDCGGCGVHGPNLDDGSHSVACDVCNVWQHSACLGISEAEAEKDDFHLVCKDCIRKEEEAKRPKPPPIKFKPGQTSSSPPSAKKKRTYNKTNGTPKTPKTQRKPKVSISDNPEEWHNTFGDLQPPSYPHTLHNFVAFKPERFYTVNGLSPASNATGSPGFGDNPPAKSPGQPPIGKFINHAAKAASSKQRALQKSASNGRPIEYGRRTESKQQSNNDVHSSSSGLVEHDPKLHDSITISTPGTTGNTLSNGVNHSSQVSMVQNVSDQPNGNSKDVPSSSNPTIVPTRPAVASIDNAEGFGGTKSNEGSQLSQLVGVSSTTVENPDVTKPVEVKSDVTQS